VRILAVGDHGQLPPVMSSGELMKNPELRLEKIHRQAEGNPIIRFAHHVRSTGEFDMGAVDGKIIEIRSRMHNEWLGDAFKEEPFSTAALCWTNKTRIRLNAYARQGRGRKGVPAAGEVVICLKNKPPVYNGMRGVLATDGVFSREKYWIVDTSIGFPEEGLEAMPIGMCAPQFNRERVFKDLEEVRAKIPATSMKEAGDFYDYGYAMTVHRSQGSQFNHVIFYVDRRVEPESLDWRRFAYTAVSRAAERLTVMV
jgi:exodeoxyribonuclease V